MLRGLLVSTVSHPVLYLTEVYVEIMGDFAEGFRYEVEFESRLSSADRWSEIENYQIFRRLIESLCTIQKRCLR